MNVPVPVGAVLLEAMQAVAPQTVALGVVSSVNEPDKPGSTTEPQAASTLVTSGQQAQKPLKFVMI